MQKKTLIIQTSPHHTASTLLVNAVYGMIPYLSDKPVIFSCPSSLTYLEDGDVHVFKSHDLNIDKWIRVFNDKYNLYFICSQRSSKGYLIDEKYRVYENVIIFDFEELLESKAKPLTKIIDNIHKKISKIGIAMRKQGGINRVRRMNAVYETIKDKPFSYCNSFYHIHGSHRNRFREQEKLQVKIGSSAFNVKCIKLSEKLNNDDVNITLESNCFPDTFRFKIVNDQLEVTRVDKNTGWGHHHKCTITRK